MNVDTGGEVATPNWINHEKPKLEQGGYSRVVNQAQGTVEETNVPLDHRPRQIISEEFREKAKKSSYKKAVEYIRNLLNSLS